MRVTSFELEDQDLRDRIDAFMARFKIGTLLNRAGISSDTFFCASCCNRAIPSAQERASTIFCCSEKDGKGIDKLFKSLRVTPFIVAPRCKAKRKPIRDLIAVKKNLGDMFSFNINDRQCEGKPTRRPPRSQLKAPQSISGRVHISV